MPISALLSDPLIRVMDELLGNLSAAYDNVANLLDDEELVIFHEELTELAEVEYDGSGGRAPFAVRLAGSTKVAQRASAVLMALEASGADTFDDDKETRDEAREALAELFAIAAAASPLAVAAQDAVESLGKLVSLPGLAIPGVVKAIGPCKRERDRYIRGEEKELTLFETEMKTLLAHPIFLPAHATARGHEALQTVRMSLAKLAALQLMQEALPEREGEACRG